MSIIKMLGQALLGAVCVLGFTVFLILTVNHLIGPPVIDPADEHRYPHQVEETISVTSQLMSKGTILTQSVYVFKQPDDLNYQYDGVILVRFADYWEMGPLCHSLPYKDNQGLIWVTEACQQDSVDMFDKDSFTTIGNEHKPALGDNICYLTLPYIDQHNIDLEHFVAIFAHERAHCNGWSGDHEHGVWVTHTFNGFDVKEESAQ